VDEVQNDLRLDLGKLSHNRERSRVLRCERNGSRPNERLPESGDHAMPTKLTHYRLPDIANPS
jgi:hypothetical protein